MSIEHNRRIKDLEAARVDLERRLAETTVRLLLVEDAVRDKLDDRAKFALGCKSLGLPAPGEALQKLSAVVLSGAIEVPPRRNRGGRPKGSKNRKRKLVKPSASSAPSTRTVEGAEA